MTTSIDAHERQRAAVVRQLAAALDFARAAVHSGWYREHADSGWSAFLTLAKFACETSLLLLESWRTAVAADLDGLLAKTRAVAHDLAPVARDDQMLSWMRLQPTTAPSLAVAHLCLARLGVPDPVFDQRVRRIVASSSVARPASVPWKDLEAAWWETELGGPGCPHANSAAALRRVAAAGDGDALLPGREELYGFTHGLIYATEFGNRPDRIAGRRDSLVRRARSIVARCLDEDDFDLLAEALLTWPYLRAPWDATARFALHVLAGIEQQVGLVPSMTLRQSRYDSLDPGERRKYVYREAYHTVYVTGLLAAARLRYEPTGDVEPARLPDAAATRLYGLLLPGGTPPYWERAYLRRTPEQQGALRPMLADIAALRAVKAGDYRRLGKVLDQVPPEVMADSAIQTQAAELMHRLAAA